MIVPIAHAILFNEGKVLLVQQRKPSAYGLWSFPGGHVESGETALQALHREIAEEVGVELAGVEQLVTYRLHTAEGELEFYTFTGDIQGQVKLRDEELLAWGWFGLESLEAMAGMLRQPMTPSLLRLLAEHYNLRLS